MGTTNTNQLDDAITVLRAAFADGASDTTMEHGAQTLETMLASLQGARSAQEKAEPEASKAASDPEPATAPKTETDLLDQVIHFLKAQLDEDDRTAVEQTASSGAFSVPFIAT